MSRCAAAVRLLLMSTSSMLNFVSSVSLNFGFASAQILSFFSEINTSLSLDGVTRSEKRASRGRPPSCSFSPFSLLLNLSTARSCACATVNVARFMPFSSAHGLQRSCLPPHESHREKNFLHASQNPCGRATRNFLCFISASCSAAFSRSLAPVCLSIGGAGRLSPALRICSGGVACVVLWVVVLFLTPVRPVSLVHQLYNRNFSR